MVLPVTRFTLAQERCPQAAARTGRVAKWLRAQLKSDKYREHPTSLLDEPVTKRSILGVQALRDLAFLLDPIIACALLGQGEKIRMYPLMPRKEHFADLGYQLDLGVIIKEARDLMYLTGRVGVYKEDVGREGGRLSFSEGLRDELWDALSDGIKSMILGYIKDRAAREGLTLGGTASTTLSATEPSGSEPASMPYVSSLGSVSGAGPAGRHRRASDSHGEQIEAIAENDELRRAFACEKRRRIDAEGRAASLQYTLNAHAETEKERNTELKKVKKQLRASERRSRGYSRRFYRARHKERKQIDLGLRGKRVMEVRNVCTDPDRQRAAGEKRKRDPSVAFECAWVMIRGTKEPRPFGGGVRWTVEARYEEFANFVRSGVDSARRAGWLRTAALHARTLRVLLVPIPRKGCLRRNKLFTDKQKRARAASNVSGEKDSRAAAESEKLDDEIHAEEASRREIDAEKTKAGTQPLEGVSIFDHPSRRTIQRDILPTCLLMFSYWVRRILYDPSTVRVCINADFAKAKSYSCMGSVVHAFQQRTVFTDVFGGREIEGGGR